MPISVMEAHEFLAFVAGGFGVIMGLSPLLQLARIVKRHHSNDVSIAMLSVIFVGTMLWTAYGISIANPAIITANTVGVLATAATILTARRFRGRE